mgnify:CR=1 FL=1
MYTILAVYLDATQPRFSSVFPWKHVDEQNVVYYIHILPCTQEISYGLPVHGARNYKEKQTHG